jgi:C4-dicarboxylate-specific signal transduction histidine kinase
MYLNKLKFRHKVYLVTLILILFFILSNIIAQYNLNNVSKNMENLEDKSEFLQSTLVKLADIEKLKRYVYEYTITGDQGLIDPIEKVSSQILQQDPQMIFLNDEFKIAYQKLILNVKKYKESFQIAKEQIPLNLALRHSLRVRAEKIEEKIDIFTQTTNSNQLILQFLVIRKALLETEKSVIRYIETDDRKYVKIAQTTLNDLKLNVNKIIKLNTIKENEKKELKHSVTKFNQIANKTIEHYRTYSMLTKVVMPGDAYEIYFYGQKLKNLTIEEIQNVKKLIKHYTELNNEINIITGVVYISLILISFFIILNIILNPLKSLTNMFEKLANNEEEVAIPHYKHNDEFGKLIRAAEKYKLINKRTQELLKETQDYKENLEKKVQTEIEVRREREKALIQQSKLASMGEMIGAIAHQWRQPLNELSIRIQKLRYQYQNDKINEQFIQEFIEKNTKTIDFMSKTIDNFRNFFRIDKNKTTFHVKNAIEDVLNILDAQLKNNYISLNFEGNDFSIDGFKTEFEQVIMNVISNSKDAFLSNKIEKPVIDIRLEEHKIYIQDNAGGIPENILDRVFEPYFTTKQQGDGTGIGLYMSKMIIDENMNGKIYLQNKNNGILITIELA